MKPKISVVVPVYNAKKTLALCLESIINQSYKNFEIIVIDDASKDDSIEIAKRFKCRIVRHKKNLGPSATRNDGAKNAKGAIILFLDSDIALKKDALELIIKDFKNKKDVACILGVYGKRPLIRDSIFEEYRVLQEHHWKVSSAGYIDSITSSICAIKKDAFFRAGGFDEKYRGADVEDTEFGHRISNRYGIFMDKRVQGYHDSDDSLYKILKNLNKRAKQLVNVFFEQKGFEQHYSTSNRALGVVFSAILLIFIVLSFINPVFLIFVLISLVIFLLSDIGFYTFIFKERGFFILVLFSLVHYTVNLSIFLGILSGFKDQFFRMLKWA